MNKLAVRSLCSILSIVAVLLVTPACFMLDHRPEVPQELLK